MSSLRAWVVSVAVSILGLWSLSLHCEPSQKDLEKKAIAVPRHVRIYPIHSLTLNYLTGSVRIPLPSFVEVGILRYTPIVTKRDKDVAIIAHCEAPPSEKCGRPVVATSDRSSQSSNTASCREYTTEECKNGNWYSRAKSRRTPLDADRSSPTYFRDKGAEPAALTDEQKIVLKGLGFPPGYFNEARRWKLKDQLPVCEEKALRMIRSTFTDDRYLYLAISQKNFGPECWVILSGDTFYTEGYGFAPDVVRIRSFDGITKYALIKQLANVAFYIGYANADERAAEINEQARVCQPSFNNLFSAAHFDRYAIGRRYIISKILQAYKTPDDSKYGGRSYYRVYLQAEEYLQGERTRSGSIIGDCVLDDAGNVIGIEAVDIRE